MGDKQRGSTSWAIIRALQKFGNELNVMDLANETGITQKTIGVWYCTTRIHEEKERRTIILREGKAKKAIYRLLRLDGRDIRPGTPATAPGAPRPVAPPPPPPAAHTPVLPPTAHLAEGPRTRTVWSREERTLFIAAIIEEWKKNPHDGLALAMIRKAMHKALPESRWKTIYTVGTLGDDLLRELVFEMKRLIEKGTAPQPPPEIIEKPVPVPVDPIKLLHEIELPTLAAVLAERQMQMQVAFYKTASMPRPAVLHEHRTESHPPTNGDTHAIPPAPPVSTSDDLCNLTMKALAWSRERAMEELATLGIQKTKEIPSLFPKVQIVGFRGHQHQIIQEQLRTFPVTFLHPIDPSAKVEKEAVSTVADYLIIDTKAAPDEWRDCMRYHFAGKCRKSHGSERVKEEVKDCVIDWRRKHPIAAKLVDEYLR